MGLQFPRKKPRNLKLRFLYKLNLILPISSAVKLRLLLDFAWIFGRMAHDEIHRGGHLKEGDMDSDFLLSRVRPGWKILDLGCGSGGVIRRLRHRTTDIIGIDHNPASARKAVDEFGECGIAVKCADIFRYIDENRDIQYNLIILSHILEHIESTKDFLASIHNMTQFVYIEVPDLEATHLNIYRQSLNTDLMYMDADHIWEFDRGQLRSILEECDLEVLAEEYRWGVMKFWCRTAKPRPMDRPPGDGRGTDLGILCVN